MCPVCKNLYQNYRSFWRTSARLCKSAPSASLYRIRKGVARSTPQESIINHFALKTGKMGFNNYEHAPEDVVVVVDLASAIKS